MKSSVYWMVCHASSRRWMIYVPPNLLKQFPDLFGVLIARLASMSFSEDIFPSMFKRAQITPLLKKAGADPAVPSNYRPITNLNTISKILEKLMMSRILPVLNSSVNFCTLKSAYRRRHSTETALLRIFNDCLGFMDRKQATVLTLIGSWKKTYVNGKGGGGEMTRRLKLPYLFLCWRYISEIFSIATWTL